MEGKKWKERLDRLFFIGYFKEQEAKEKGMRLVFGPPAFILAAEIGCELLLRKNYDQASRISADLIDRQLQDKKENPSFSQEEGGYLNWVLSAISMASDQCRDIPLAVANYEVTPIAWDANTTGGVSDWEGRSKEEKLAILNEVIDQEIRPYIELDAGGVTIEELSDNGEVHITYQGSCTSCHSATGSTLTAIQQILKSRVHPSLTVVPNLS